MATAKARYPALFEFLEAWFAEADLEGRDDAQVIAAYRAPKAIRAQVVREGRALLQARPVPWRQVAASANRRFANEATCVAWLASVITALAQ